MSSRPAKAGAHLSRAKRTIPGRPRWANAVIEPQRKKMVAKQKVYKLGPRLVRRLKGFTRTTIMAIPPGSASADNPTGLLDRRELSGGVKQRRAERWAHRRLGKLDHERRVDQIAQAIFDLTRPMHGLGAPERRLLRL